MNIFKCLLLVFLCFSSSQAQIEFDVESFVDAYGSLLLTVLSNPQAYTGSAAQVAQCSDNPAASGAIGALATCAKNNYANEIPVDIINDFLNAKNARVSICDIPDGDAPGSAAFSLSGEDVSELCPEGELFSLSVPFVFNDVEAVYTIYSAKSITLLNDNDILAVVTDADGAITSAVASSVLPPGVSISSTTGAIYVSNRGNLRDGTFSVTVTTTDATTGTTTQTIQIVLLAALCPPQLSGCAQQCYDPANLDCVNYQLAPKGFLVCASTPYDPAAYNCFGTLLCPKSLFACGQDCYSDSVYTCYGTKLCPKNYHLCGTACYDPVGYDCCNASTDKMCAVGNSCAC